MVAGGEVTSDLKNFEEMLPKFRDELRSSITDDIVGETMMLKYFTHNNSCGFFTSDYLVQGMKCATLVYRSTIVKIAPKPFESGRFVIKSKEKDCHGLLRIRNGSNKQYG